MQINLSDDEMRPLVRDVVAEVLRQLDSDGAKCGERLGYPEPEAAALIGVPSHVLRDARLRGEITARLVGRRYIYSRSSLLRYLDGND